MTAGKYYVYILSNKYNNVLYIGVTSNLQKRMGEHAAGIKSGFAKRYNCDKLVYIETFTEVVKAIAREKELKRFTRDRKNNLIAIKNPLWENLL